jgi:hypothetical protein
LLPSFSHHIVEAKIETMMIFPLLSLLFLASRSHVSAERYTFDLTKRSMKDSPSVSLTDTSLPVRSLQSDNKNPCYINGDKIVCIYSFMAGSVGNETTIDFMAQCDSDKRYGFEYRKLPNCACLARVTPAHGVMKECPCSVCAVDLGETPVSVDCSGHEKSIGMNETETVTSTSRLENITDANVPGSVSIDDSVTVANENVTGTESGGVAVSPPVNSKVNTNNESMVDPFIFAECTSIDCFGACNGTCSLSCNDPAGNNCPYCENYAGVGAPTSSPIGGGKNDIVNLGEKTSNAKSASFEYAATACFFLISIIVI